VGKSPEVAYGALRPKNNEVRPGAKKELNDKRRAFSDAMRKKERDERAEEGSKEGCEKEQVTLFALTFRAISLFTEVRFL